MLAFLPRSVVIACAFLLLVPCLIEFLAGAARILMWWSTRQPDHYNVTCQYLHDGITWTILGAAGIVGSSAILFGCSRSNRWLWLPTVGLLYFILAPLAGGWFFHRAIHPMAGRPLEIAMERTFRDLSTISSEVVDRAKSAGMFTCHSGPLDRGSAFESNGMTLDYQIKCLPTNIDRQARIPFPPGTIAMSVSADGREAWFSVTSLKNEADTSAVWLRRQGEILPFHRSLQGTRYMGLSQ